MTHTQEQNPMTDTPAAERSFSATDTTTALLPCPARIWRGCSTLTPKSACGPRGSYAYRGCWWAGFLPNATPL